MLLTRIAPPSTSSAARTIAPYDDAAALDAFAAAVDVVTYEFENVDVAAVERLARSVPVRPGPRALAVSQDRLVEKRFLRDLGIATAPFAAGGRSRPLEAALGALGRPAVLKTRRFGYDGKGQARISGGDGRGGGARRDRRARRRCSKASSPSRANSRSSPRAGVDGRRRGLRPGRERASRRHPASHLRCRRGCSAETAAEARRIAERILHALDYVGVIGVEFFVVGEGSGERLLVNEIAPRVHNSGHWTEDACAVSQFENHIRAVAGWPLGPTTRHADVVMTNLIGDDANGWRRLAAEPGARLHLYGKREARPGRKMGHVNRLMPRS